MTHAVHPIDPVTMADWMAARGGGLTAAAWTQEPLAYVGSCATCYEEQILIKGAVAEYGVRGIYICQMCGYAYPYGSNPPPLDRPVAPPSDDDVRQAVSARERLLHAMAAELCEGDHESV